MDFVNSRRNEWAAQGPGLAHEDPGMQTQTRSGCLLSDKGLRALS